MTKNMWDDWLEQQTDKTPGDLPKRILKMRRKFGTSNEQCGSCWYFERQDHHNKTYFKCLVNGSSNSQATDWRVSWPGCGLHRTEAPVLKCLECGNRFTVSRYVIVIPHMFYVCPSCGQFKATMENYNEQITDQQSQ